MVPEGPLACSPGITSAEALHADHAKDEDKWVFPDIEPTALEQKRLLGAVLEIGVRAAFENSVYQFGGRYYHQQKGSPTGRRLTMAAARVIMSDWSINITKILEQAEIKIWLKSHHVDEKLLHISTTSGGMKPLKLLKQLRMMTGILKRTSSFVQMRSEKQWNL
mgnify:CR=1 FL=1